jgi:RluA family pseudouridine synthase
LFSAPETRKRIAHGGSRGLVLIPRFHLGVEKWFHLRMSPCVIFEDEHLLVVHKPAGWNTHAPGPHTGEGIYDWLRHREPRWATLAILHRLDKETSGVMVFGKTPAANRSLTEQFTERRVRKKYLLLTDRPVPQREFAVKTALVRTGEKYASRPPHAGAEIAETKFCRSRGDETQIQIGNRSRRAGAIGNELETPHVVFYNYVEALPLTGRTHQIRVHAAESGFPILGDTLYGGTPAARVFLHAAEISFAHPATGEPVTFHAPANFDADPRLSLRAALFSFESQNFQAPSNVGQAFQSRVAGLGDFSAFAARQSAALARRRLVAKLGTGKFREPADKNVCSTNAFRLIHGASGGWENSCFRNPNNRCAPNSVKNWRGSQKRFPRAGRITKSCRGRCGARPRPRRRRSRYGASPRRSGLRFARTASVSSWVSTKVIPRGCFWTNATIGGVF